MTIMLSHFYLLKIIISGLLTEFAFANCPQNYWSFGNVGQSHPGAKGALNCYPGRSFSRSFDPDDDGACISNGEWSEAFPDCKNVVCPQLIEMNHGFLSDKTKNTFGAVVEYGCRRGFIIKGPKVRICQCSGEWSGGEPKCIVPPTCPDISAPTNGFITTENVDTFYEGIKIQFACNAGFTLTGKSITTCHIGRGELLWSHSPPTCETSVCVKPQKISNGGWEVLELFDYFKVGAELIYDCDFMYENTTQKTIECLSTGKWNTVNDPACIRLVCSMPEIPRNSHLLTSTFKVLNYAEFECDDQYSGVGDPEENKIYCHLNKTWSKTEYTCKINICSLDSSLLSPRLQIDPEKTEFNKSDVIKVGCKDGKWPLLLGKPLPDVKGSVKIRCKFGGFWSRNINDVQCAEVCGIPPVLLKGSWQYDESKTIFLVGTVISYKCDEVHENTTQTEVECESSGMWVPNDPGCVWITCPPPKLPANSHLLGKQAFKALENEFFECDEDYAGVGEVGSNKIYCFSNKTWSSTMYKCISNVCGFNMSMLPPHSQIMNEKTEFKEDESAVIECVEGKKMFIDKNTLDHGESSVEFQCTYGGVWKDDFKIVECASACTMYSKPARGYWTEELKSYYYAREVINFECDDLHENVTLKTVQCLVTGMWDILFPGCVWITCSPPEIPANSHLIGKKFRAQESTSFECDENYVGVGDSNVLYCYPDKTWSTTDYECIINFCTMTNDMLPSFSKLMPEKQEYTEDESVNIQCVDNKKIFINGSANENDIFIRCEFKGKWSDNLKDIECALSCMEPPSPTNGKWLSSLRSYYMIGDSITYECDAIHEHTSEKDSVCLSRETWSVNTPGCVWITCSEPEIPKNSHLLGSEFKALEFTTFECDEKYTGSVDTGQNKLYCYSNKTWSSTDYVCLSDVCFLKPSMLPPYTKITPNKAEYAWHELGNIECIEDRFLFFDGKFVWNTGKQAFTCKYGGVWDEEFKIVECVSGCSSEALSLVNANWSGELKKVFRAGESLRYDCHTPGTYNTTERIVHCLGNRIWSSNNPGCEWLVCPEPVIPSNSYLVNKMDFRVLQAVTFRCDEKYVGQGMPEANKLFCKLDTTWTTTDFKCLKNFCESSSIALPASSEIISPKSEYAVSESILIICRNQTWPYLNGIAFAKHATSVVFVCSLGGAFSPDMHILECGITCEIPVSAEPAIYKVVPYANLPYYLPGSNYTFNCIRRGYTRSGNRNFTCLENGMWSPISGCHYVTCYLDKDKIDPSVATGIFSTGDHKMGTWVPLLCVNRDGNYRVRNGSGGVFLKTPVAKCMDYGDWNVDIYSLFCERVCRKPTINNGGILDDTGETFFSDGESIQIKCNDGYVIMGEQHTTCLKTNWSLYGYCIMLNEIGK